VEPLKKVPVPTKKEHHQKSKPFLKIHTSLEIKANLEMRAEMVVNVPDEEGKRVE
jgi:hypothetical protein